MAEKRKNPPFTSWNNETSSCFLEQRDEQTTKIHFLEQRHNIEASYIEIDNEKSINLLLPKSKFNNDGNNGNDNSNDNSYHTQ